MCVGGCPHIRVREILKRSLAAVITRKSRRKWYHIRTNWFRACVCANEISVVLWSFSCCCSAVAIAAPVTHDLPLVGYLLAIKEQWVALSRLPWILFKVKYRFSVHSSTSTPFTRVRTHPPVQSPTKRNLYGSPTTFPAGFCVCVGLLPPALWTSDCGLVGGAKEVLWKRGGFSEGFAS